MPKESFFDENLQLDILCKTQIICLRPLKPAYQKHLSTHFLTRQVIRLVIFSRNLHYLSQIITFVF